MFMGSLARYFEQRSYLLFVKSFCVSLSFDDLASLETRITRNVQTRESSIWHEQKSVENCREVPTSIGK